MEEKPSYYSIITADVRYDKSLKDKAKLLYSEITALTNKNGYCYANNKYFADLYGVSTRTITDLIKDLVDKNYIHSEIIYEKGTKKVIQRRLYLLKNTSIPMEKNFYTPLEENFYTPLEENFQDNNISINNTSINNKEIYKEIIDYLNVTTNKHYKHTDSTIKLIKARLNEGFTVSDFKNVIDKKTKDWGEDQKMKDYLRPQTLFSNKFEGYLNQEEKKKSGFMGYMEEFYGKENNC